MASNRCSTNGKASETSADVNDVDQIPQWLSKKGKAGIKWSRRCHPVIKDRNRLDLGERYQMCRFNTLGNMVNNTEFL